MLTNAVKNGIEAYQQIPYDKGAIKLEAMESVLHDCQTQDDWQTCIDEFGERYVGSYIADNADDLTSHPYESSGIAYIKMTEATAIMVEWNDQGFYDVEFTALNWVKELIMEYDAEFNEEDES